MKSREQRTDGDATSVYDYAPLIEHGEQKEGIGTYHANVRGDEAVTRTFFPLIEYGVMEENGVKVPKYRQLGQYTLELPKGHVDFFAKLVREGDSLNLTLTHPASGEEWVYHRVQEAQGIAITLPQTVSETSPPPPSTAARIGETARQKDMKEILEREAVVEALANELLIEAKTRLGLKQIDEKGRSLLLSQMDRLEEKLQPVSLVAKPVGFRYVAEVNQMRALIHDMQVTKPPLLDKTMAAEWLSKIAS